MVGTVRTGAVRKRQRDAKRPKRCGQLQKSSGHGRDTRTSLRCALIKPLLAFLASLLPPFCSLWEVTVKGTEMQKASPHKKKAKQRRQIGVWHADDDEDTYTMAGELLSSKKQAKKQRRKSRPAAGEEAGGR